MWSNSGSQLKERSSMRASPWLAGLSLLALGACASDMQPDPRAAAGREPITPSEQFAIEVQPAPLELKLGPHTDGVSSTQAAALRDFIGRWNDADRGMITIKAPAHGSDPEAVYRTATGARDFLVAQGVSPEAVRIVGYDAGTDPAAPVLVGFLRYEAKGPTCGQDWENLVASYKNESYAEFGCSVTANIAAQIADPEDLLHPRAETPPDGSRRQVILEKYRQGSTTAGAKDSQANGAVSSGVGQ
jgi:pilus assembly protein CpaD